MTHPKCPAGKRKGRQTLARRKLCKPTINVNHFGAPHFAIPFCLALAFEAKGPLRKKQCETASSLMDQSIRVRI